jgi:hypothetical protein
MASSNNTKVTREKQLYLAIINLIRSGTSFSLV